MAEKHDKERTNIAENLVTMSEADLNARIAASVTAALTVMQSQDSRAPSAEEQFYQQLEATRGKVERRDPTLKRETTVRCVSPDTGAAFNAVISPSSTHPNGRVVRLESYEHPKGVDMHQGEGGLVPDGMPIQDKTVADGLSIQFKQWRWENFYQADLRRYVSKSAEYLSAPIAMK